MRTLGWGTLGLVAFVACSGSVTTIPDGTGGANASSGTSGTSGGGSSGSSGSSGGVDGGVTCTTATFPGDRACVPGRAKANASLTIDVDASKGCLACFTTIEPCRVTIVGTKITVGIVTKTCKPSGDQVCPEICRLAATKCTLPPMAAGTYTVEVEGDVPRTGLAPPRQLVLANGAEATSCTLLRTPPEPLDGTKYATACEQDVDCVLVTTGNLCQPCACPTTSIAKSASEAYGADHRALSSQCPSPDGQIACAACAPLKAKCQKSAGSPGTCTAVPGF